MRQKLLMLLFILVFITVLNIGCATPTKEMAPTEISLEDSIKQIINSKGENYNFLEDESYMEHMEALANELVKNKLSSPPHYEIGNLDDDNIPEIAVFQERDAEDMEDEGSLEIYKFDGEKYTILDRIPMNYDNTNYQMAIGKIAEDQRGLFLNNHVGAHSGLTYGFILEENKLKNILNDNKLSLLSIYPNNEIKDINNDGILEFSIYTIDPETEDSSVVEAEKMTLWYKWDGKDSATLVTAKRKDYSKEPSNEKIFKNANDLIKNNLTEFLGFMEENKDKLSKYDNTELLKRYIAKLNELEFNKGIEINDLFISYQKDDNHDYLLVKYGLPIEKFMENLNSLEYLKREKVLKDEGKLKEHLISHILLGYKLHTSEGMYYYLTDNQKLLDIFEENISYEYKDYLRILAMNTNKPYLNDGRLTITMEALAERILLTESFRMVYPHSELLEKVHLIYSHYLYNYFYGDIHVPNFNEDTFKIKDDVLEKFHNAIEKYTYTNFANLIRDFIDLLKENNYIIDHDLRQQFDEILN